MSTRQLFLQMPNNCCTGGRLSTSGAKKTKWKVKYSKEIFNKIFANIWQLFECRLLQDRPDQQMQKCKRGPSSVLTTARHQICQFDIFVIKAWFNLHQLYLSHVGINNNTDINHLLPFNLLAINTFQTKNFEFPCKTERVIGFKF